MTTAQDMLTFDTPRDGPAPLPPRPYQTDAITAMLGAPGRGVTRPMCVIPTGGGKTVVFAHMVHRRPGRVLVMAHRDELIDQAAEKLAMVTGRSDIGIVKAEADDAHAPLVVGSVQTLTRPGRIERVVDAGPLATVIVDEAHHSVAPTYLRVLGAAGCLDAGGPLTAGFTATAMRTDKLALGKVWQEIAYQIGIVQMIAEDYLCDVRGQQIGTDFDLANVTKAHGDYTDGSLGQELERSDALEASVEAWLKYAVDDRHPDGRQTVAFTPTVATAHALAAIFRRRGVPAEAVDGTTHPDDRRDRLARVASGETRVIVNCAVLTEGWDCPPVSCGLMLRPTQSAPFFVQMAGRILRKFTGLISGVPFTKGDALLLDIAGNDHKLATLATLAGLKERPKPGQTLLDAADEEEGRERGRLAIGAARTQQVELLRRGDLHWIDVEGCWVLPAGAHALILVPAAQPGEDSWAVWRTERNRPPRRESHAAFTLDWAQGVGEEVARAHGGVLSQKSAAWRAEGATKPQRDRLRALSIEWKPGQGRLTRGAASDLITANDQARVIRYLRNREAR